jgi:hypothetical protein
MIGLDISSIKNVPEKFDIIRALRHVMESAFGLETALAEENQDDVNLYGQQLDKAIEEYTLHVDRLQARLQRLKATKEPI